MARMVGIEQNTPAWVVAHVGCVTASHMHEVADKLQDMTKMSAKRRGYLEEKILEVIDGYAENHPVTEPMQVGIYRQPFAKTEYELRNGIFVADGGYWMHDRMHRFRASPDYLVGSDGLLETKCPQKRAQFRYYTKHEIPEEHKWQMRAQMAITGRQWCDWVSYNPDMREEDMQYIQIRFPREKSMILATEVEVQQFLLEVDQMVTALGAKRRAAAWEDEEVGSAEPVPKMEELLAMRQ